MLNTSMAGAASATAKNCFYYFLIFLRAPQFCCVIILRQLCRPGWHKGKAPHLTGCPLLFITANLLLCAFCSLLLSGALLLQVNLTGTLPLTELFRKRLLKLLILLVVWSNYARLSILVPRR